VAASDGKGVGEGIVVVAGGAGVAVAGAGVFEGRGELVGAAVVARGGIGVWITAWGAGVFVGAPGPQAAVRSDTSSSGASALR
jgi:hypothetical protein